MAGTIAVWETPEVHQLDNDFFRPHERKQLQNAYQNFVTNTRCHRHDYDDGSDDDDNAQMLLQSKIQLFQLFIRTQPVNIRSFSLFHQQQQRVFVERLFYLVLNNVELTHFSTFNVNSIISISKELEKYQRSTNKVILNTGKLNTVIQFVLSFSSSTIASFSINNLFYLLLNDMSDFSGKIIDRIAELLRIYHAMTYGHTISKQYLITTIDHAVSTANFANPVVYPLYENFLSSSFVYRSPLAVTSIGSSKMTTPVSLYTIVQNLAILLLGLTLDDFEWESKYLALSPEICYNIRLTIRRLTYLFKHRHYTLEFPLINIDKRIVVLLINAIIVQERTYDSLRRLLDLYMTYVRGFSEHKTKRLLYDLLSNTSFELYAIETIGRFIEMNRLDIDDEDETNVNDPDDELWLTDEQIRLVTHKLYSKKIYHEVFLPLIDGDSNEERTIADLLAYMDINEIEHDEVIDVQDMRNKLTILP